VYSASSGEDALRVYGNHAGKIDLLVSDLVMPGMNGVELARRLTALSPGLRVVHVTGYPGEALAPEYALGVDTPCLLKPFTPVQLLQLVRETLEK
jgi:two-component system, cell cycle sensor histidine kinase and response regulator CckA